MQALMNWTKMRQAEGTSKNKKAREKSYANVGIDELDKNETNTRNKKNKEAKENSYADVGIDELDKNETNQKEQEKQGSKRKILCQCRH